ncbi:glycoside hydrolase family 9 protein [Nibricoccus sp. IMCC34717]|uniref:glycoside hydrolase family 9 protein n=1 Tax=Nibricoccus sp. IMCC34717 TaxID=3034021 RepID=UPI003850D916
MRPLSTLPLLALLPLAATLHASDVIGLEPLSQDVLVVHFKDGRVVRHSYGEKRSHDRVLNDPVDLVRASDAASYRVLDAAGNAVTVSGLWRKTKPTEFGWITERWDEATKSIVNKNADRTHEHWIYLRLAAPLKAGEQYTVDTGTLAKNGSRFTFAWDLANTHSEAIHVNNLGYAPEAPEKVATLSHWAGDGGGVSFAAWEGKPFQLVDTVTGAVKFTGQVAFRMKGDVPEMGLLDQSPHGNMSNADTWECDFSAFKTPGEYRLAIPGVGASFPFRVQADAYREAFYWTMKGLYQNRSGIQLCPPYATHYRPAPHNPRLTPRFAGRLQYTTTTVQDTAGPEAAADKPKWEAGLKGPIDTWGWYQDAGDWDAYSAHTRVPSNLLFLYDVARDRFSDGELNIPESGNGVADVLDEAAWLVRFYHRTRHQILERGYGTGGVGGARVTGDFWGSDQPETGDVGSWDDVNRLWVVSGEEANLTFKYSAMAAQLARLLERDGVKDPEGVDWKREALETWAWATTHIRKVDTVRSANIQAMLDLRYCRMQAAAALYRLTGEKRFEEDFRKELAEEPLLQGDKVVGDYEACFAALQYLLAAQERPVDDAALKQLRKAMGKTADEYLIASGDRRAGRWGGDFNLWMLIGQSTTPIIAEAVFATELLKGEAPAQDTRRLARIYTTSDYFLGNNPLNTTWITGVGERSPRFLFHMDSWAIYSRERDQPGIIPYGPWTRKEMLGGTLGPWANDWPSSTVYPQIDQWPGHERWFDQYTSPLGSEFTVHQTNGVAAVAYGFLCAKGGPQWKAAATEPLSN